MPKSKEFVETSSESGSGSESDSDSAAKKKSAPAKSSKSTTKSKASEPPAKKSKANEEPTTKWQLEKNRYVNINSFHGKKYVDIREFYEKNGEQLPGKKGIALSLTQWKALLSNADEITKAIENQ